MLRTTARKTARREAIKAKLAALIETIPTGVMLDHIYCSREQVPAMLAFKLTDALGRRILSSLVAEKLGHLGLNPQTSPLVRRLCDDLRELLEAHCPNSIWGSAAGNMNRTLARRTSLLTSIITEMIEDRQLFVDPDATFDGRVAASESCEWHLVITAAQRTPAHQEQTA